MQEAKLQMVKLTDIVASSTNTLQREEWELKPEALKELAESIASKGVIQPILVRPDGSPGKYYLVCGERRFLASKQAGQTEIPAYIRDITNEEAFDLQITENLQRKDVHPLKEAQAYKALMDADRIKNSIHELSKRFGKPVDYITQRLAFNNLIAEMKKEFFEGKMLIGHAIAFSRLTPQDQKLCMKECKPRYGPSTDQYEPLKTVTTQIEQKVIRNLTKAIFNIHDASLVTNAGSCDNCPKRSGHNTLLFSDVKEQDRCFDGACFELKTTRYIIAKLDEFIMNNPDADVVGGWNDQIDANIKKHLETLKVKMLKEYDGYRESSKGAKGAVRAFAVAGNKAGRVVWIEKIKSMRGSSPATKAKPPKNSPAAIDEQIKSLRESLKSQKDEMEDKIVEAIAERLIDLKPYLEPDSSPLTSHELAAMYKLMYDLVRFDAGKKVDAALKKISVDSKLTKEHQDLERFAKLPDSIKNFIVRKYISSEWDGGGLIESDSFFVRRIASQFKGVNVKAIEDQFLVDINKKEIEVNKKIKDLQDKKKGFATPAKSKSK